MHNLKKYPEYANHPVVKRLIEEGWEFRVDEWVDHHKGTDEWQLQFKSPRLKEWYSYHGTHNGKGWEYRYKNWLKDENRLYAREQFETRKLAEKCFENFVKNDCKKIELMFAKS